MKAVSTDYTSTAKLSNQASSFTTFRWKLKTHLFWQSYPDIVLQITSS